MSTLEVTNKLRGDFGELAFEHFCIKNNYAYLSLEDIYTSFTPQNFLKFRFGNKRVYVKIPDDIVDEIRLFCRPTNKKAMEPHFVYDFLTVSLKYSFSEINNKLVQLPHLTNKAFYWIEIKTGKAKLSKNQKVFKEKTKIGLHVFRINHLLPDAISVEFEGAYKDNLKK